MSGCRGGASVKKWWVTMSRYVGLVAEEMNKQLQEHAL
jgi:hypothetical protein